MTNKDGAIVGVLAGENKGAVFTSANAIANALGILRQATAAGAKSLVDLDNPAAVASLK